jgi:hypothetical protein
VTAAHSAALLAATRIRCVTAQPGRLGSSASLLELHVNAWTAPRVASVLNLTLVAPPANVAVTRISASMPSSLSNMSRFFRLGLSAAAVTETAACRAASTIELQFQRKPVLATAPIPLNASAAILAVAIGALTALPPVQVTAVGDGTADWLVAALDAGAFPSMIVLPADDGLPPPLVTTTPTAMHHAATTQVLGTRASVAEAAEGGGRQ